MAEVQTMAAKAEKYPPASYASIELVPGEILTMDEAASLLRLSKSYLYRLVCEKAVPHIKVGAGNRFSRRALVAWLEARCVAPL